MLVTARSTAASDIAASDISLPLAGRLGLADRCFPQIRPVYDPDDDGVTFTDSNCTHAADAVNYATGTQSLKMTVAANTDATLTIKMPETRAILGDFALRVRCSDWSKVYVAQLQLIETINASGGWHKWTFVNSGYSPFNCNGYPWDADTWRILRGNGGQCSDHVSPTAWGTTDDNAEKTIGSLKLRVYTTAAGGVDFWIDKIVGEAWSSAMLVLMTDGFYSGAREYIFEPFRARGWKASARAWHVSGAGIYPSWADLDEAITAGWEVGPHLDDSGGGAFGAGSSNAELTKGIDHHMRAIVNGLSGYPTDGQHYATWLTNVGRTATGDAADVCRLCGIRGARGGTQDPIFQIDPFGGAVNSWSEDGKAVSWVSPFGRYNLFAPTLHDGASEEARNDFSDTWEARFNLARRWHQAMVVYTHDVEAYAAGVTPGSCNIGTTFAADMIAHLDTYADEWIFGGLGDLIGATFDRPGDWYVNDLCEWVSRRNAAYKLW